MASLIELTEIVNLENWMNNHGKNIVYYPETSTKEYDDAVKKLISKIKEGVDKTACDALKKMYVQRRYYVKPILMSKKEFCRIIDEFHNNNFENLERLEMFFTTTARVYHLDKMKKDYNNLIHWYRDLKNQKDHTLTIFRIIALLMGVGIPPKSNELYELPSNPEKLKKRIDETRLMCRNVEKAYMEVIINLPFDPIENILKID